MEAFTFEDELYCAPKDFSTLGLVINQKLWDDAGLTEDDVPTSWEELEQVAGELTQGDRVGLAFGPEYQRVGAFFPQAGGAMVSEDGTEATVDSPENLEALEFVQGMIQDGIAAYSSDLGAGWGGEAFGKELAAMTIEGNWIAGAMPNDFPKVDYTVAELPHGPAGPGTLAFTNCWGIAEASGDQESAVDLVEHLTSAEQQLDFADAFGVIPSVQSAAEQYAAGPAPVSKRSWPVPSTRRTRRPRTARPTWSPTSTPSSRGSKDGDPAAILDLGPAARCRPSSG